VLRSRYRRFTLLGAAALLVLTGCGSGPAQAGSAAIIGDTVVPLDFVQGRLDTYLKRTPQDTPDPAGQPKDKLDKTARDILSFKIQHELTLRAAQREGVAVGEDTLSQLLDQAGGAETLSEGTFFDAESFRNERARDQLLQVEIGRKYVDKLAVTFDYFSVKTLKDGVDKAKQVARDPNKMAELLRDATAQDLQAGEADKTFTSAESPQLATTPLFGVPAGTVVVFQPGQDNGTWVVAHVKERKTDAKPSADASSEQLTPQILAGIGLRVIQLIADETEIKVNPRYGVWDSSAVGLAASDGEKTGFQVAVHQPKS
jgi:hypothetical protein